MSDPFRSSKRRIGRAKTHIIDLDAGIKRFLNGNPCSHVVEPDADGVNHLHKIKFTVPIPELLDDIAFDALGNLRAALDQAGYAVAVAAGAISPKFAYFPVAEDATNLDGVIKGRCKDIPNDIITLFRGFEPYAGGNDLIWALNKANNVNKHRLLVPSCVSLGKLDINIRTSGGARNILAPSWDGLKNELVFAVITPDTKIEYNAKITYCVSFDEIEVIRGEPAAHILDAMASEVESIVMATEAEARRLGLVA